MGKIHEEFILKDMASQTLNSIVKSFQSASMEMQKAASVSTSFSNAASVGYQQVSTQAKAASQAIKAVEAQGQIDILGKKLASQNNLIDLQRQKVNMLVQEYAKAAIEAGEHSLQTQKVAASIERAIIKQTQFERAAAKTQQEISSQAIKMQSASTNAALYSQEMTDIANSALKAEANVSSLAKETESLSRNASAAKTEMSTMARVWSTVKNAAIVTGGIALVKNIASASDQQSVLNSRLATMTGSLEEAERLQKSIYQMAQGSRANYANSANMVGMFGTLAPDAFGSTAEIVNFVDQINKHLKISGTSGAGADAVILQLTQAMGAGVLRGEELNSVLEQTPTIAQAIAQYMGVSVGEMRELASEGQLTADVVKNALFATAEQTNEKFSGLAVTFSELWQSGMTAVLQAAIPFLQTIGKGATFIHENWDTIAPILMGVAAAAGVVAVALAAQAAATWLAKAANDGLIVSLLSNPLTLIAMAIAVVVAQIYKWIQSVGGITVAWLIAKNYVLSAWESLKIGFMTGIFAVQNWLDQMHLKFVTVGVNIANAVGDMKVNVLTIIQNMVNGAISLLNSFISSVNKIPGVSIALIDKVTFAAEAAASNEAAKSARSAQLAGIQAQNMANTAARSAQLAMMQMEAQANQTNRLAEIANAQQEAAEAAASGAAGAGFTEWGGDIGDIGKVGSVGSVKNVEGDVNLSDEDLKLYRDLAERRYMNQIELKTLAPNIQVTLPAGAGKNLTADDVANKIKTMLIQQMASNTAVSH